MSKRQLNFLLFLTGDLKRIPQSTMVVQKWFCLTARVHSVTELSQYFITMPGTDTAQMQWPFSRMRAIFSKGNENIQIDRCLFQCFVHHNCRKSLMKNLLVSLRSTSQFRIFKATRRGLLFQSLGIHLQKNTAACAGFHPALLLAKHVSSVSLYSQLHDQNPVQPVFQSGVQSLSVPLTTFSLRTVLGFMEANIQSSFFDSSSLCSVFNLGVELLNMLL